MTTDVSHSRNSKLHGSQLPGFGLGAHMCLGQHIARAQIEEGLHLISHRLLNPKTTGAQGYRPFPGTWGIRGLPITFDLADTKQKEAATAYLVEQLRLDAAERTAPAIELEQNPAIAALEAAESNLADEMRLELTGFADGQPEDVATLLRGWLVERN